MEYLVICLLLFTIFDESETRDRFEREDFSMEGCCCRSTSRIWAGSSIFLFYISDICDNLNNLIKLFADHTSLFSVIENEIASAEESNRVFEKI